MVLSVVFSTCSYMQYTHHKLVQYKPTNQPHPANPLNTTLYTNTRCNPRIQTAICTIFWPACTCGPNLGTGFIIFFFCGAETGVLLAWPGSVFVPGYGLGFASAVLLCAAGGTKGFGANGLTAVLGGARGEMVVCGLLGGGGLLGV